MKIVKINDVAYMIEPFKGAKGFKLKHKVLKVLSPAFEKITAMKDELTNEGLMVGAIQSIVESSETEELFDLIVELVSNVKKEDGFIDFDTEFTKNYVTLYKLVYHIIMENYGDLFQELGMNVG